MSFAPSHILVPVSLGPKEDFFMAKRAIFAACDIAEKFNSKITLLHLTGMAAPAQGAGIDISGTLYHSFKLVLQARLKKGQLKMQELEKEAENRGIQVESRVLDSIEETPDVICTVAKELNADLIVMTTHARKGLSKMFLGSVSEKVFQRSLVNVLILPPKEIP